MKKYFERFNKRNQTFGIIMLGLIAVTIVLCGGFMVAGGLIAAVALPALTDEESLFVETVKGEITKEVEKFKDGHVTKTQLEKLVAEKMDAVISTRVSKEDYESLKTVVEEQGLTIKGYEEGVKDKQEGSLGKFFKDLISKESYGNRSHAAKTTIKAAALMTTDNVVPETASGFSPLFGNYIDTEVGTTPKADPVMLPLISVHYQPGTEKIYYSDRINEEGDAAFIAEGGLKPLADAEWKTMSAPVEEVAVRWKQTKRLINHAASVISDFKEHVNELIELKIDDNLIAGGGATPALNGIEDVAAAFIAPSQLAVSVQAPNIYDAIMAVATQVRLANHKGALTATLNTQWMAQMASIKNANNDYIIPPFVTKDGKQVGEVKIVFTNQVSADVLTLGDLKKFHAVIAEEVEYDEGYENDDFSKNLVSKKLESFLGTYIKQSDVSAIVSDDIATIITAIEKVIN